MPKIVKLSALKKGRKATPEKPKKKPFKPVKGPDGKKQEPASMTTIAEAIRQAAREKRERPNVDMFPSSIFLVYSLGLTTAMFYHIPASEFEGKRGKKRYADVIESHNVWLTERSKKYWLHLAVMGSDMRGREEGEWHKYAIPDDEPFTIKGTFRVVSTGFAG